MAKKLAQLTQPLRGFVASSPTHLTTSAHTDQAKQALRLKVMRGDALIKTKAFEFLQTRQFSDALSFTAFERVYLTSDVVTDFVQQAGLLSFVSQSIHAELAKDKNPKQTCYALLSLLVDSAAQAAQPHLVEHATTGLLRHYLPSFYPKASQLKTPLAELRRQAEKAFKRHYNLPLSVKESFEVSSQSVSLRLILKVQGYHDLTLLTREGKRLNQTKAAAYKELLSLCAAQKWPEHLTPKPTKASSSAKGA